MPSTFCKLQEDRLAAARVDLNRLGHEGKAPSGNGILGAHD